MKTFNFEYFWNNVDTVEAKKKVSKEGKLNCSSNELIHPDLSKINDEMLKNIPVNVTNCYIYYPKKIESFSALLKIPANKLQLYAGSDDAIKITLTALGINCQNMIIQNPNYENYFCYARLNQYTITKWNMDANLQFNVTEGIRLIRSSKPSIVILTTPNGFTGYTMSREDIKTIILEARENNSIVIIDQAYAPFDKVLYTDFSLNYDNVIVISTLSKGFGLAGARLAYTCACETITSYLSKWNGINSISALSYEIGQYYLTNKRIKEIVCEIVEERTSFIQFINANTSWHAYDSKSNFVLIRLASEVQASEFRAYLNEHKIIVRKLDIEPFKDCIRITVVDSNNMVRIKKLIQEF